jgi:hypothetical protein
MAQKDRLQAHLTTVYWRRESPGKPGFKELSFSQRLSANVKRVKKDKQFYNKSHF